MAALGKSGHPGEGKRTHENDDSLPSLPLPSLKATLTKYLGSLEPLVDATALARNKELAADFEANQGRELQAMLAARCKTERNWLEAMWLRYAYLLWPNPITLNSNYFIVADDDHRRGIRPSARAAHALRGMVEYHTLIREQAIPPEYLGSGAKAQPLCMAQYHYTFGTTRIPGEACDRLAVPDLSAAPRYAVAIAGRRHYRVVLDGRSEAALAADLEAVVVDAAATAPADAPPAIGLLTAGDRRVWAGARAELLAASPINAATFAALEGALCVVSFDPACPETDSEAATQTLAGDAAHRYFDKVQQLVVYANGRWGFNNEHSPMDAMCAVHLQTYLHLQMQPDGSEGSAPPAAPLERLNWVVPPSVLALLTAAAPAWERRSRDLDLNLLRYVGYGDLFIKRRAGCSPDSYAQLALQLAYLRLTGRAASTYETAMTRLFYHGRTETVRACTAAGIAWAKLMLLPTATLAERHAAFVAAAAAHMAYLKDATIGAGADRHLLGLRVTAMESGLTPHPLFSDPAFAASAAWTLATSNTTSGSEVPTSGGFGPTGSEGHFYGLCYAFGTYEFRVSISSWRSCPTTDSTAMAQAVARAFDDMGEMFNSLHLLKPRM